MQTVELDPPGFHQVTHSRKQTKYRNAGGVPATPAQSTTTQTRAASVPPGPRTSQQITSERAALIAEADQLQTRSGTQTLTPEEDARYDFCLSEAERLASELTGVQRAERLAAQRSALQQPARPAPTPPNPATPAQVRSGDGTAEGLQVWLRSFTNEADLSSNARHVAQQSGFPLGSSNVRMGCSFGGTLNRTKRRALSKGASPGSHYVPVTYSDKVTEYITAFSPIVGMVDSEVTADGNDRTYFIVDDTALISDYITASSGTELNPTIPDRDITTGSKVIKAFEITSGYHKVTQQAVRDSAVSLEDKIARAIGHSHARRMERDLILGTGTTMPDGLVAAGATFGSAAVDDFSQDLFEDVYFSTPEQYRSGCVWLVSPSAMARMRRRLRDTTGRSLFSNVIEDGAEVLYLHGCRVVTSNYMPAFAANNKPVLFFNPMFYMLRLVEGQSFNVLKEKFFPHIAYAGGMAFGGAWLGPASACTAILLDANPGNGS
jgi:HK97 family phage major capsid protein